MFLCGFLQLITEGYTPSTTFSDYYSLSSEYRTGGGVFGGAVCISTASAFGVVGGTVIIVLVLLVSLIIITQRSFFGFMNKILDFLQMQHERAKKLILRDSRTEKSRRSFAERSVRKKSGEDPPAGRRAGGRRTCPYRGRSGKYLKKTKEKARRSQKERQAAVKANREGEFNLPSFLDEQRLYFRQIQS